MENDVKVAQKLTARKKLRLMDCLKERRILVNRTIGDNREEAIKELKILDAEIRDLIFWCDQDDIIAI